MGGDDEVKGFHNDIGFGPSDRPDQRPLALLVICVADFCGAGHNPQSGCVAVDAHEFDGVLASLKPRPHLHVENRLGGGNSLEVNVVLESMKDFEPRRLAAKVPALAAVLSFVQRAEQVQEGKLAPAQFKQDLSIYADAPALSPILDRMLDRVGGGGTPAGTSTSSAPPGGAAPTPGGALDSAIDSIFSMVETAPRKVDAAGAIDAAAASVAGAARFDLAEPIAAARKLLDAQLGLILRHPQWRAMESAWRGLLALCKSGKSATIQLLDAPPGQVAERLENCIAAPDRRGEGPGAIALIVCDFELPNNPAGMDTLHSLADLGQELQAPVVVGVSEAFLGRSAVEIAAMDAPANLFQDSAFDKWRSLREKESARWLAVAWNAFAARTPFQAARHGFSEVITGEQDVLWANPAWLVAASVANSFELTGWPCNHTGMVDGEVPSLPVFDVPGRDSQYPLQAIVPDNHLKDLSRSGLIPLACQANHDSAWVLAAPVARLATKAEQQGKVNSLGYALLASRLGAMVTRARGRLVVVNDPDRTQVNFEQFLEGLLSDTGPGAGADVRVGEVLELTLRVGRIILNGVELHMALPLA